MALRRSTDVPTRSTVQISPPPPSTTDDAGHQNQQPAADAKRELRRIGLHELRAR